MNARSMRSMCSVAAITGTLACTTEAARIVEPPAMEPPPPSADADTTRAFIWSADQGMVAIPLPEGTRFAWASAINNRGDVVGWYGPPESVPHAFIWSQSKGFRDIHPSSETNGLSAAVDINEAGQVVAVTTYGWDPGATFVWQEGAPVAWITHHGDMIAHAINDLGDVVGQRIYQTGMDVVHDAFIWNAGTGAVPLLSSNQYPRAVAFDINNSRQVVGSNATMPGINQAPVLWNERQTQPTEISSRVDDSTCGMRWELHYSDYACAAARTLNDGGQAAGAIRGRAFRTDRDGSLRFFPAQGKSFATAINNNGEVVGMTWGGPTIPSVDRAFVWRADGRVEMLPPMPGRTRSVATDINDRGQVVGYSR